jgi:leucyl-tRNA---protein transferase
VRALRIVQEDPRPCTYLEHESASLTHQILLEVDSEEYEARLAQGERRFGFDYFYPSCPTCTACEPTRVPIATFLPSKSQRRVLKNAPQLTARWGIPQITNTRLELYRRWHKNRENERNWSPSALAEESYESSFAMPLPFARELSLWNEEELVLVSLFDETERALSAVYCFFDPALSRYSLGTLNILTLLARGKELGKAHLYLGYHVKDCASLRYKAAFQPQERRIGRSWVATSV